MMGYQAPASVVARYKKQEEEKKKQKGKRKKKKKYSAKELAKGKAQLADIKKTGITESAKTGKIVDKTPKPKPQVETKQVSKKTFQQQFSKKIAEADKQAAAKGLPGFEAVQEEPTAPEPEPVKEEKKAGVLDIIKSKIGLNLLPVPEDATDTKTLALELAKQTAIETAEGAVTLATGGVAEMLSGSVKGAELIVSGGLSNANVAKAAAGSATRLTKATNYISQTYKTPLTTKAANTALKFVDKITKSKTYQKAAAGWIGTTVLNGFLEEEADQTISFAIDKAIKDGNTEEAKEMLKFRKELIDTTMWEKMRWLIPAEGIFQYIKAANYKARQQEKAITTTEKTLTEGFTPSPATQAQRLESEAYYAEVERKKQLAKKADRKEEAKYYQDILDGQAAAKEKERKEDAAYWDGIREANKKAKEDERAAEEAYWAGIRAKNK